MRDAILLLVPAFIGVVMVGALVFWLVVHPDKDPPTVLVNSIATILGYYFGMGTAKVG